ncbi:hypothetical protein ACFE04_027398 [Oxalis oulophora]
MEEACGELPEGCIAHVASLTSPREASRLAVISPTFKAAVESDAVWNGFFPSDFQAILSRSLSTTIEDLPVQSKKDLFMYFAQNPILIDGGKLSFWLDKSSGKKSFMLSAANLAISWGDTPEYWTWYFCLQSRFDKVAQLICVCWFEVTGKFLTSLLSPSTHYAAFLVFNNASFRSYGFKLPIDTEVGLVGSETFSQRKVYLEVDSARRVTLQAADNDTIEVPMLRADGWFEVELGDFYFVGDGSDDGEVQVRLFEINRGNWKGNIVIQGIEMRPKGDY